MLVVNVASSLATSGPTAAPATVGSTATSGQGPGYLEGRVSIGPLQPVERVGVPPPTPSPAACTSRGLVAVDVQTHNVACLIRLIVFLKVESTTSGIRVLLGILLDERNVIGSSDRLLSIRIEEIGNASEDLRRLIRPRRSIPLAFSPTSFVSVLPHVVLVRRLVRSQPIAACKFAGIHQMSPSSVELVIVVRQ